MDRYDLQHRFLSFVGGLPGLRSIRYTASHGVASGLQRVGGLGWLARFVPMGRRQHEAEESLVMELVAEGWFAGRIVYDVGGDQGLYALAFADAVGEEGQVLCYEPVPASQRKIQENIAVNRLQAPILLRPVAVGATAGSLTLAIPGSESALTSADPAIIETFGKNTGRVQSIEVPVVTLDAEIAAGRPIPSFVKIDVEGFELAVLEGMHELATAHRPRLLIEMHGADEERKLANARDVVAWLLEHGYVVRHVESDTILDSGSSQSAARGHLDCT